MSNKKYYWLKLHKDFFKSKEMKKLRKIAGGDTYTIIYLKLQLLSLENSGKLFFEGVDDSFADELALEIDEEVENVQATFIFLQKVGLLEMVEEDELSLTHVVQNIGSETPSASRKRKQRAIEKQEVTQIGVTMSQGSHKNVTTEKEKELDTEIKTEKDNTPPTPSKGAVDFEEFRFYPEVKEALEDYASHIKTLGKSHKKSDKAWTLFKNKALKFVKEYGAQETQSCIFAAIESNWKTLYPPKNNTGSTFGQKEERYRI